MVLLHSTKHAQVTIKSERENVIKHKKHQLALKWICKAIFSYYLIIQSRGKD